MRIPAIAFITGFCLMAAMAPAQAAPQAMLLVANGDSIPFRCADDLCLAEATSICLQKERATPRAGTPYEPVDERRYGTGRPNGLQLVGITAAGAEKPLPVERMRIVSERDHMAVRFVVDRLVLEEQALDRLELRVTEHVVIAPMWMLGDPYPHLDDELELVLGPIRATAERVLRERQETVTATRLLGDFLNDLPRDRVASIEERNQLYERVVAARSAKTAAPLPAKTLAAAQEAIDACDWIHDKKMWFQALHTPVSRYRRCVAHRHDKLIKDVNKSYWDAREGAGS
ncbi:MAG: hypothetical protein PVG24_07475 [Gammaproteobacteria bacterium]|jgi:hypothetical protein